MGTITRSKAAPLSFSDIVDTGTEGTKVASGTTAQRGTTAGQFRFNSTTGKFEGGDGSSFVSIEATPTITSIDDTEVDSEGGGNQTIVITGTNFATGDVASFIGSSGMNFNAATTTIDSATQITAVAPKASFLNAQEPYGIRVTSTGGLSGNLASQINVDNAPTWTTAAGNLGTITDTDTGTHATLVATDVDGDTISYAETGGTNITGAGLTLNSSTGVISGDPTDVGSSTTVSFDVRATAGSKTADRSFNIIIKPPVNVYYLVVAGGGAGANNEYHGGGGGAGGYRTNYGGTAIAFSSGIQYTCTVGTGGTIPSPGGSSPHTSGVDSTLSGSNITDITSTAGGRGENYWASPAIAPATGGSGGGGKAYGGTGAAGNTPSTSPSQGNAGGGGSSGASNGGGGGGATSAGTSGGVGGNGTANSITGSSITYAGGGGGGWYPSGSSSGGSGGGGAGSSSNGSPGTDGLGGGGGASERSGSNAGGVGGDGIVILRMLTSDYTGTTTGTPTVTTDGSDTIIKFTGTGSYTA